MISCWVRRKDVCWKVNCGERVMFECINERWLFLSDEDNAKQNPTR